MPEKPRGTCFVVMGFGKKTDFETGRTLDLDMSYLNMIKPAVEKAGLKCIRADEIVHSGLIDVPMYEQLLTADVVVADISTSNKNALYELGVRHALRPYTTVVIAEDGIKVFPFDLNHVVVRQYHHLGEDIGVKEARRFGELLTSAIVQIMDKDPREKDSPVYRLLSKLDPPALGKALDDAIGSAKSLETPRGASLGGATPDMRGVHSLLMQEVDEAQNAKDFVKAKTLLASVRAMMKTTPPVAAGERVIERPEDPYIIQRLALLTYKSKHPTEEAALKEAKELLATLNPATSNDTETLGLWGSVHKRLWESTKDTPSRDIAYLDEAVRSYERGFYLRNDYYNGINLAYLLNVRCANASNPAEAIADFIHAERIRREVIEVCRNFLDTEMPTTEVEYWVKATQAEACFGLRDDAQGQQILAEAFSLPVAQWMKDSTQEQLDKLRPLLADSPLKYLKAESLPPN